MYFLKAIQERLREAGRKTGLFALICKLRTMGRVYIKFKNSLRYIYIERLCYTVFKVPNNFRNKNEKTQ